MPSGSVQNTDMLHTVDSGTYLTTIFNLVPNYWDNQDRALLLTFSNLVGILRDVGQLSGEAQELLHRKVGKLYNSYHLPSIVQFSYVFAKEVLNSSSRPQASERPSLVLSHLHSDAPCYVF